MIPKTIKSYYSKLGFKVKYVSEKELFNEINCKKLLISNNKVYERRDEFYNYLPTVMFRGTPCIYNNVGGRETLF